MKTTAQDHVLIARRLTTDASEDEKAHLSDLIKQYIAKDRCGVLPLGETELYFVAASKLASGLLKACVKTHGLADLPTDSVLLAFVHRKVCYPTFCLLPGSRPSSPAPVAAGSAEY